jgi:hypothetical protein
MIAMPQATAALYIQKFSKFNQFLLIFSKNRQKLAF